MLKPGAVVVEVDVRALWTRVGGIFAGQEVHVTIDADRKPVVQREADAHAKARAFVRQIFICSSILDSFTPAIAESRSTR